MGRRKNIECRTPESSRSGIDQNMLQRSRRRFFFQPICDEYLGTTSTQDNQNIATFQQDIPDMMKKRKHHSVDKALVSNQAESSSCKKPRLFVGAFQHLLPFRDSISHGDESSDDEAEEGIQRIVSGVAAVHY